MSKFYIVATPIGNLSDISLRTLEVFKSVSFILCEDTRVTRKLLNHYKVDKPLISYHQHSSKSVSQRVIKLLSEGKDLALVSDAGTPGIQDPGGKLISELVISELDKERKEIEIIPIPGPSAVTTLLSVSGMPTDSFLFVGFIPKKKGRKKVLEEIVGSIRTAVFYESGYRILKTLTELHGIFTQNDTEGRKVVIGRELTKKFETIYRGTIEEVLGQLEKSSVKGEFVVAISGTKLPQIISTD